MRLVTRMGVTVNPPFDNDPVLVKISDMPGLTEKAVIVDEEIRYSKFLYGKTQFILNRSDKLTVEHVVDCISRRNGADYERDLWQQISKQRNLVWATLSGRVVGYLELWHNSVNRDLRFLNHPFAWEAHSVFVAHDHRRNRIGSSLYAHVRHYGYQIQPVGGGAPGNALWDSMHPGWKSLIGEQFDFIDTTVLPRAEARFACGQRTPPLGTGEDWWLRLKRTLHHPKG